jgi:CRP-like cAMP-binding protein
MPAADRLHRISRELAFTAFAPTGHRLRGWIFDRLASAIDEQRLRAGDILFAEGDPPESLYFMSEGGVRMARDGAPTWTFEGRWVLGSHEVLLERPRGRTAVALTDLELVTVRADAWLELIEDSFDIARLVVENTARWVAGLYDQLGDEAFAAPAAKPSLPLPGEPLNLVERLLVLSDVAMLRGAGVQALTDLAAGAEEVTFAPDEEVLAPGVPRDRLFIIADGEVEASREEPAVMGRFGPGDIVVAAAALGEPSLAWRAHAQKPTRALAVRIETYFDELEEHFDLVRAAMTAMAEERERLLDQIVERTPGSVFR